MRPIILLLSFAFVQFAFGTEPENHPFTEAATSIENQESTIQVRKDGSTKIISKVWMKALNDQGRVQLSVQKLIFDPFTTDIQVIEAGVEQDGEVFPIAMDKIQISDVSSEAQGISKFKSIEIPFRGVKTGGVIFYKTIESKKKAQSARSFSMINVFGFLQPEMKGLVKIESALPLQVQSHDPHKEFEVIQTKVGSTHHVTVQLKRPVFRISPAQLSKLSLDEIKEKTPRALISSTGNWEELRKANLVYYDDGLKENVPQKALDRLQTLKTKKTEEQVEAILTWIAENLTYSGRWISADSGLRPRKISEIFETRAGDCKDFALITMAFLKVLNIESEPVYVGVFPGNDQSRFLKEPIDETKPLATLDYFNHVVVRYKSGDKWHIVDPGRGLGDSIRTPYFLLNNWAFSLGKSSQSPFKIQNDAKDYAGAIITSDYRKKPDGNLVVDSKVEVSGELSNYLKSVYFGQGEQALIDQLSMFATGLPSEKVKPNETLKVDRSSKSWTFGLTYNVSLKENSDSKETSLILSPPYFRAVAARMKKDFVLPQFPVTVIQTATIPNYFAPKEIDSECIVRGPIVSIDRRVENLSGTTKVQDIVLIPASLPKTKAELQRNLLGYHVQQMLGCFATSRIPIVPAVQGDPKQISFESGLDLKKAYQPSQKANPSNDDNLAEIRRIDAYLKLQPKDVNLLRERAKLLRTLGYYSGQTYIPEYLEQARETIFKALEAEPNNERSVAFLGQTELFLGNEREGLNSFLKAFKLNPKNYFVLKFGAEIAVHRKDYTSAVGYYRAAEMNATEPAQKSAALYEQAYHLCLSLKRCEEGLPLLEKSLSADSPDGWDYHNAALIYERTKNYKKVIELERKALKQRDFGLARETLVSGLVGESWRMIGSNRVETDDFPLVESYLMEAYKLDPKSEGTLFTMIRFYGIKAHVDKKTEHLETAYQYLRELENSYKRKELVEESKVILGRISQQLGRSPANK